MMNDKSTYICFGRRMFIARQIAENLIFRKPTVLGLLASFATSSQIMSSRG